MIPTPEQLKSLPTIRFPAGNKIPYGHDFGFYLGIPSDRDWWIVKSGSGSIALVREGYGVKGHYGSGCLLVSPEHIAARPPSCNNT
jgi:hypothetical protein